jgi:hypothetical protein
VLDSTVAVTKNKGKKRNEQTNEEVAAVVE